MTPNQQLQCMTTASWLAGYVDGIEDKLQHAALITHIVRAAELLMLVWEESQCTTQSTAPSTTPSTRQVSSASRSPST
jgi:hypothetical protein